MSPDDDDDVFECDALPQSPLAPPAAAEPLTPLPDGAPGSASSKRRSQSLSALGNAHQIAAEGVIGKVTTLYNINCFNTFNGIAF